MVPGCLLPFALGRRATTLRTRDARQRALIATRAMANREMRERKLARDTAVAQLVYGRIFKRTGGVVRAWAVIIANVNRLLFLVSVKCPMLASTFFPLSKYRGVSFLAWPHSPDLTGLVPPACYFLVILRDVWGQKDRSRVDRSTASTIVARSFTQLTPFNFFVPQNWFLHSFELKNPPFLRSLRTTASSKQGAVERAARQHNLELHKK